MRNDVTAERVSEEGRQGWVGTEADVKGKQDGSGF